MKNTRIVIVGGVAGGASAAARARRMNESAEIVMLEKDEHVSFANCGLPYYVGGEIAERDKLLLVSPQLFRDRFCIDVRTRNEALRIDRENRAISVRDHDRGEDYELPYDKLILAPGAVPIVPPMDGVDADNVFTLRNVADVDAIKGWCDRASPKKAVVVGGGYIGLEMVEQLVETGVEVTLVELLPQVLPLLDPEMALPLREQLEARGVDVRLGDKLTGMTTKGDRATAARLESAGELASDMVIMGIGVKPLTKLADDAGIEIGESGGIATNDHMQTSDPDIYAVGDAAEYPYLPTHSRKRIALAGPANRAGRIAGEHAATGHSDPMPPVIGTAIVRVFDLAAGITGLSLEQARRLGLPAKAVTVIHNHHVGYYPGAKPITLKVIYTHEDGGRILGAQAIGEEGVDKRIDVIATAMRFGGTVRDLAGLDFSYAPPYGSAKDAVHHAAFAACNELDGLIGVAPSDADLSDYQVVDVRSKKEVQTAPLANASHAAHIPLDELRDRLGELDPSRPTVVSCASGVRSYNAGRILKQHGFDAVLNLNGAAKMRSLATRAQNAAH